jgi:hypothetical protein
MGRLSRKPASRIGQSVESKDKIKGKLFYSITSGSFWLFCEQPAANSSVSNNIADNFDFDMGIMIF